MSAEDGGGDDYQFQDWNPESGELHCEGTHSWGLLKTWGDFGLAFPDKNVPIVPKVPLSYEDNLRSFSAFKDDPDRIALILKHTRPQTIAALDELREELTEKLPGIIESKNYAAAKEYYERAMKIIRNR